jgi:hypothetical protein
MRSGAHRSRSWRVAVIAAGSVLGIAALWLAAFYGFVVSIGCNGSDAGEPPDPGSFGHTVCDSPLLPATVLALALGAGAAPVWGGMAAARRGGSAPLLASLALAAGAIVVLGLIIHAVEEGTENAELIVGAPLLACLALAAVAARVRRDGD